jgi:membrane protein DedA with SNARE-associated domain/uncharacterized membrane protein YbhN (UPF0104 family)
VIATIAQTGVVEYVILFAAVAASWIGIPIVGAGALATAGVLASQGELSIWLVVAVATAASCAGGYLGYWLGARAGGALVKREGPWLRQRRRAMAAGERIYQRWGPFAVFVTPTWVSGAMRMPRNAFLLWNAFAALASTCIAALGAYGIGAAIIGQLSAKRGEIAIAIAAVALGVLATGLRLRRRGMAAPRGAAEPGRAADEQAVQRRAAARRLRTGLMVLVTLVVVAGGLILAIPGLNGVERRIAEMTAGGLLLAIGLELLSGHGYVVSFAVVFPRAPLRFSARMPWLHFVSRVAWLEQGFQAVVPAGGAAAEIPGALVLRARGMSWGWIAERSTVLFLLTSAINAIVISAFGLGLSVGILPGPSNPLLGVIPTAAGVGVLLLFLALPAGLDRMFERRAPHRLDARALRGLANSIRDVKAIVFAFDWRLIGPVAYLLFDIAVLWVCFDTLGHAPPLTTVVLGYQIGYLTDIIPVPGGVGVLDGGMIGALVLYGANGTTAAAAVLVYHAIALAVPLAVGAVAFLLLPRALSAERGSTTVQSK